jgi:hypothetical protein
MTLTYPIFQIRRFKAASSEVFQKLEDVTKRVEDSIQRSTVVITSLSSYIQNMNMENVDPAELLQILDPFDRASEEPDLKAVQPKKRQEELRPLKSEEGRRCTVEEG